MKNYEYPPLPLLLLDCPGRAGKVDLRNIMAAQYELELWMGDEMVVKVSIQGRLILKGRIKFAHGHPHQRICMTACVRPDVGDRGAPPMHAAVLNAMQTTYVRRKPGGMKAMVLRVTMITPCVQLGLRK